MVDTDLHQADTDGKAEDLCASLGKAIVEAATQMQRISAEKRRLAALSKEAHPSLLPAENSNYVVARLGHTECALHTHLRMLSEAFGASIASNTQDALRQLAVAHGRIQELKIRFNDDLETETGLELDLVLSLLLSVIIHLEKMTGRSREELGLSYYCYPHAEEHEVIRWAECYLGSGS